MAGIEVVVNQGTGGDLNPGLGGSGGPVATAVAEVRSINLSSSLGDALAAQAAYGWDQVAGTCRIVLPAPSGGLGDTITLTMGAGNNIQRFTGTLRQLDTTMFPHSVSAIGKGPLYALDEYTNDTQTVDATDLPQPGLDISELVGAPTATLKQVVVAVLNTVGIGFSDGNIDDPDHVYGIDGLGKFTYNSALVWGTHETASSYIHRFLEASTGYRLFDSSDGQVYMKQITANPGDSPGTPGTSDLTFTLGEDIFGDSSASDSSLGQYSGVLVEGWDDGSGPATSGLQGGSPSLRVYSNLIETDAFATEIASFWLPQVNRSQRIVRLTTPRDDLIGPGCTVTVSGVSDEPLWVKSCTAEIDQSGSFSQHLICVAGAG